MGRSLVTSPGVHRPSTFSALLASTLGDTGGRVVVDAGCGAGLVTLAALAAGAEHVVAQDTDPASLADTAANVESVLGVEARSRLTFWEADWRLLAPMHADVLAVNPPQRPAEVLADVDAEVLHLHDGGGRDGFDGLRLVLAHTSASTVRTTATSVLDLPAALRGLLELGWDEPRVFGSAELEHDPAWRRLLPGLRARVDVLEFSRPA
ncbi:ribosomal protein L11 methyltransferase PrmA [Haloactinopolyspora alba]|uniref:Ribosomal protein L11 methyltransferase PrmA n=1 Tax=Haloactinopolyspora alba TaxID=648780 RepID=A0A2P8E1C8_9ACTN|nr:ribosomal protein L11 methyltransferase PrmA [Haloactinopolyspora alba]